jgi:Na+-transporting NADH:ubiquinone oxidoreductase subunit NqrC
MDNKNEKLMDLFTYILMASVLLATVTFVLHSWKQNRLADQQSIDESMYIANIVETDPLPEIIIKDPILPRALPPLVEGGEVYFEDL